MANLYFVAVIEEGDVPGYGVFFPDLPGCASAGDTVEAAARNAEEALTLHLSGMVEDGEAIPAARQANEIEHDPDVREVVRLLVKGELPGRSVRLNISMDEGLVSAIDAAAKARDTTRSGFLAEAARRYLAR
jgi:predicted RNase H-like HicB family nuclease